MVMDRLTKRIDGRLVFPSELIGVMMTPSNDTMCQILTRLAAYEDIGLEPEEIADAVTDAKLIARSKIVSCFGVDADHVRELVEAEQTGRLVVLPCKVGDHVWADGREAIVVWFFGYKTGRYLHAQFLDNAECTDIPFYEIGKNRLSAREDAEVLKGGEG